MGKFYYPKDIDLKDPPLVEAWLELRWKLQLAESGNMIDEGFPYALGIFYSKIKDQFGERKDLGASRVPIELVPHIVRHQFKPLEKEWPLLQIGSGVASANFSSSYNKDDFLKLCEYLRINLLEAYHDYPFEIESATLRYKNTFDFSYTKENFLPFLEQLNVNLNFPDHIPGKVASKSAPTSGSIKFTFDLADPKSTGSLFLSTGTRKETGEDDPREVILTQLEISSGGDDVPKLNDQEQFTSWLASSHSIIHEWFFALIDGPIMEERLIEKE